MTKQFDKTKAIKSFNEAVGGMVKWQNGSQRVLLSVAPHAYKGEGDAIEVIEHIFNKLASYETRFKMELKHLEDYLSDVAHIKVESTNDGYVVKAIEEDGATQRKCYDNMKATPWYKYRNKDLKAPTLNTNSFVTSAARGLITGDVTEEEIDKMIEGLKAEIEKKKGDKKVIEWAAKYLEQEFGESA